MQLPGISRYSDYTIASCRLSSVGRSRKAYSLEIAIHQFEIYISTHMELYIWPIRISNRKNAQWICISQGALRKINLWVCFFICCRDLRLMWVLPNTSISLNVSPKLRTKQLRDPQPQAHSWLLRRFHDLPYIASKLMVQGFENPAMKL